MTQSLIPLKDQMVSLYGLFFFLQVALNFFIAGILFEGFYKTPLGFLVFAQSSERKTQ